MHELTSPAREILDHLIQHPESRDTFEGIAQWWILEQSLKTWMPKLDQAIAELIALGYLEAHSSPDGVVHYRGNRERIAALATAKRPPTS